MADKPQSLNASSLTGLSLRELMFKRQFKIRIDLVPRDNGHDSGEIVTHHSDPVFKMLNIRKFGVVAATNVTCT